LSPTCFWQIDQLIESNRQIAITGITH
jgi:hypothetical protein